MAKPVRLRYLNILRYTNLPQRARLHRPSPPSQPLQPLERTRRIVPRRIRQDTQTSPLVRRQAAVQRRHERHTVPQGLLPEAGR